MKDMDDATAWYEPNIGTVREIAANGMVRDVPPDGEPIRKLTDNRYGLHLTMNADWCVILSRSSST
jgi:hypothetical protein